MNSFVVPLSSSSAVRAPLTGEKGAMLARMIKVGLHLSVSW